MVHLIKSSSASATISGNITLGASPNFIGIVTVANPGSASITGNITLDAGSKTQITGNLTLSDSKGFIGLTTTTLGASPAFIGIVTVANPGSASITGNITLDAGSKTQVVGNLTLTDSKGFIGLTTTTLGASPAFIGIVTVANAQANTGNVTLNASPNAIGIVTVANQQPLVAGAAFIGIVTVANPGSASITGNITLDAGSKTQITGNLTLSDSKAFIGLTTSTLGASPAFIGIVTITNQPPLTAGAAYVGLASVNIGGTLPALSAGANFIGLVTVVGSLSQASGNITLDAGSKTQITGNLTLSDSKAFIGLTTSTIGAALPAGANFIGLVTIVGSLSAASGNITLDAGSKTQITGNLTLSDSKGFIGLTTTTLGASPAFIGIVTITNQPPLTAGAAYVGLATIDIGTNNSVAVKGNLTLSDSKAFIGLTTTVVGSALPAGANFIGLVTIAGSLAAASGNITLDAGSKTQIVGNLTLSDSKAFIGLVTATLGSMITVTLGTKLDYTNDSISPGIFYPTFVSLASGAFAPAALDNFSRVYTNQVGNLTLSDSKGFIGLTTTVVGSALPAGANFIGLVTISGSLAAASGNITLDAGSKTQIVGNLTLSDSKAFIGLTTSTLGASPAFIGIVTITNQPPLVAGAAYIGLATIDIGTNNSVAVKGNLTLSDSKAFIGLTTTVVGSALPAGANFIGLVTVVGSLSSAAGNITLDAGSKTQIVGNLTLSDSKTFIGLTTTTLGASPAFVGIVTITNQPPLVAGAAYIGLATIDIGTNNNVAIKGNLTLSDSKAFIGLTTTTLGASPAFIGLVTAQIVNQPALVTGAAYIGLVTSVPAYGSNSTVFTAIYSVSGNNTLLVAGASLRFFIKNLHLSSLGRSEVEIRSGATTLIPFTSLSTTSGFFEHYGEQGLPARANADALVVNLNGTATVSIMANVRFE